MKKIATFRSYARMFTFEPEWIISQQAPTILYRYTYGNEVDWKKHINQVGMIDVRSVRVYLLIRRYKR